MMCENDIMIQHLKQSSTTLGLFTDCIIPCVFQLTGVVFCDPSFGDFSVFLSAGYTVQSVDGDK